ncbi:hypothetical protein BIU88_09540 [Chlorobaculum limnaeum]|uniref:Uncharacterized protein n=1 Tax=Chlorobaculum limnaeum TaxID=274537 RepID=A0A1D8D970_CHLLM|nr:hypothetical protein BIU88_09540 [Chlorobaculum limnaeum]
MKMIHPSRFGAINEDARKEFAYGLYQRIILLYLLIVVNTSFPGRPIWLKIRISKGNCKKNTKNISGGRLQKAEAAQRTASLLLPHMVDELCLI